MQSHERFRTEQLEKPQVDRFEPFDFEYFKHLEGAEGWTAIGQGNCWNQQYFTVIGKNGEKLGIVGIYDADEDKNITHTIVDPKYRGLGLARAFKDKLLDQTGKDYYIATVNLDNNASLAAMQKIPGAKIVSTPEYEETFQKRKFRYDRVQRSE